MLLAALIISEAKCESKLTPLTPLCLITVDSMKAFDVVSHIIVLDKLYETGVHPKIWTIVKNLYNGMTSKVRWAGGISDNLKILQGVRQGGILSPLLYKIYNNNLLMELQMSRLGFRIGNIFMGCPTCADDIALLSTDTNELQCMLSTLHRQSLQDRVTIHPTKTKAVVFSRSNSIKSSLSWKLGDSDISPTNQAVHLGILRSELKENVSNIEDRISISRRTMYALLNTGLHGSNGINPIVSYKIYQFYVIPKLLYGLEVLPLNNSQLDILKRFHISNLRRFQSLPTRTATCKVYLILGALPIDAEIHKRHLSLLHNILTCNNTTIRNLLLRHRAVNGDNCDSFFGRIQEILEFYKLPDIDSLLLEQPSKLAFKYQCKCAIQKTWTNLLKAEIDNKSTLKYINANVLAIGTSHTLWKSLRSMVSEVKMGITKARMLTGTFMTQATRYKFKIENVDHICQLCAIYSEDIKHILLECPALHSVRQLYYSRLKVEVIRLIGEKKWLELFGNQESILLLIFDCSNFSENFNTEQITVITKISTELCHQLYIKRLKLLEGLRKHPRLPEGQDHLICSISK
ncbi:unnamed protein product [Mytilus coruscus]|uniref:Reverse transcriptase domain-containing protein n=1 Tax=Mytilus coruscus TaxID=42192 RepID=A0A6J8BAN1_MYTCO|nr:unnamed protein product [Mytilus coruscus]